MWIEKSQHTNKFVTVIEAPIVAVQCIGHAQDRSKQACAHCLLMQFIAARRIIIFAMPATEQPYQCRFGGTERDATSAGQLFHRLLADNVVTHPINNVAHIVKEGSRAQQMLFGGRKPHDMA